MPTQLATIRKDFKHYTDKIKKNPHNPLNWITRANFFLGKYPEPKNQWPFLAVGDAYKAYQYFCDQSFRVVHEFKHIPDQTLQSLKGQACNILVPALLELGATIDAKQFVDDMTVPLSTKHRRVLKGQAKKGSMKRQRYPWIPASYMHRENYLNCIRADLHRLGLSLRPSTVGPKTLTNLGVFADRDFGVNDKLFREPTQHGINHDDSLVNYFIGAAIDDFERGQPLHLLNHPDIGSLSAAYTDISQSFGLQKDIIGFLDFLMSRGVELLWDMNFDLWVLHTVKWRCGTNSFELTARQTDVEGKEITRKWEVYSRLTSFFQHSCDSNATWSGRGTYNTMFVTANRAIKRGDEIFDSYGPHKTQDVDARRKDLKPWLGVDCMCPQCVIDEKARRECVDDSGVELSAGTISSDGSDCSSDVNTGGDTVTKDSD
jgi:SET domain